MTIDDFFLIFTTIAVVVFFIGIIMGCTYFSFKIIKTIMQPMFNLRPIEFKDFVWYNIVITFLINAIFINLKMNFELGCVLSIAITILYMHYYVDV